MSMQALNTSSMVSADSPKGQRAIETFRAQYNKARLDDESAQRLNEHPGFAAYIAAGIRQFSIKGRIFPVYLEIEVGGKSKDELLAEMESGGIFYVSDWAKDIMSKPAWTPDEKGVVKFARATVRELGFTNPDKLPTTDEVWARIKELGHQLCEPCDGPAIRLALKDQPRGDYFWVAMQQITDSDGDPDAFYVCRHVDGERWLRTDWVYPDAWWNLGYEIVFRLRK